ENLRHLPYATGAADRIMYWDVSTSSNKPHCLIVGPTGGGKTSVIRTLLTEAARRGVPFVGVDPKMIELDGLDGYPGCGAIIYDALRAAMFVRALHTEMMARNAYIHQMKIEGSQLPLMIAVLDEFFILSGKWQRLAKIGDDETREQLKELDPLGAWADLAVLARSAGIRLLLGVQRPDASLFGGASGNARDNFGTRISLGNLSQDGALMMWGDSTVGCEVDTSVKGRGVALGDDGHPVDAQMWWTPNVDRHPNKWNRLAEREKAIIDGLLPTEAPQFTCYSQELASFIESERALATRARRHGRAPEPIVLGARAATDGDTSAASPTVDAAPGVDGLAGGVVVGGGDGGGDEVGVGLLVGGAGLRGVVDQDGESGAEDDHQGGDHRQEEVEAGGEPVHGPGEWMAGAPYLGVSLSAWCPSHGVAPSTTAVFGAVWLCGWGSPFVAVAHLRRGRGHAGGGQPDRLAPAHRTTCRWLRWLRWLR
ncbi:type IV secretory system conjugative DNA transfer family protein, partial [Rhodococcus koreensis]